MKSNKILVFLSFFALSNIVLGGFFNDDANQDQEIQNLKEKQLQVEQKLNQLDKKLDAILKAVSSIKTGGDNKSKPSSKKNTRKPADPNYVHKIDQGNSMFMGNPNAKVTVTEFFDFQ